MLKYYLYNDVHKCKLTKYEMMRLFGDCKNNRLNIDIRKKFDGKGFSSDEFNRLSKVPKSHSYKGMTQGSVSNATLGHFNIKFSGDLKIESNGCAEWCGDLWIDEECSEIYDFDPNWRHNPLKKDNKRTNRQELNVLLMHLFSSGNPFIVISEKLINVLVGKLN